MDSEPADVDRRNTLPRLTTAQAAARLGVRRATLYAYVSRGLIASRRAERGGSTFDPLDVEALARDHRRPAADGADGLPLMVLDSPVTQVTADGLLFRGVPVADLATAGFERAVELLWAAGPLPELRGDPGTVDGARAAATALGAVGLDLLRIAVLAAGAADALRADLAPDAVRGAGARLIGTVVDALPVAGTDAGGTATVAARLWSRLADRDPDRGETELLDAALVTTMDNDLAASTFAARVAASARADPYACVQAALGAFGGALHGTASTVAAALLEDAVQSGDPDRALARAVAARGGVPGFGHVVYRRSDPRMQVLIAAMRRVPRYSPVLAVVDRLSAAVGERLARPANVDLALAALQVGGGLVPEAAATVFAVGRIAGWIAHIVDEYSAPPLRLRPRARYSGAADTDSRAASGRSTTRTTTPVSASSQ